MNAGSPSKGPAPKMIGSAIGLLFLFVLCAPFLGNAAVMEDGHALIVKYSAAAAESTGIRKKATDSDQPFDPERGLSAGTPYAPQSARRLFRGKTGAGPSARTLTVRKADLGLDRIYVLTFAGRHDFSEILRHYRRLSGVVYAQPNYTYRICREPDDPAYVLGKQWAYSVIDAPAAWDVATGESGVVIAVVDTGVDYGHPDLVDNMWRNEGETPDNGVDDDGNGFIDDVRGWDFVDENNDPADQEGHGTHVAGIAGAVTDNVQGVAGTAWSCRLMAVRAGDADGEFESARAAPAIVYAVDNGARVINLSWGGSDPADNVLIDALGYAERSGAVVCAAAGNNDGSAKSYPAAYNYSVPLTSIIAVGASDRDDQKAAFSNYGDWVDLFAPGKDIYSTVHTAPWYEDKSGTSMATPFVAGAAALLFSFDSSLDAAGAKSQLLGSVDVLPQLQGLTLTSGRLNLFKALTEQDDAPRIFALNPTTAHAGDAVTIYGDRFGGSAGRVVAFPEQDAAIVSWTPDRIVFLVPAAAESGPVVVEDIYGRRSNARDLALLPSDYTQRRSANAFSGLGIARGWQEDIRCLPVSPLPFTFPFFGERYAERLYVSPKGYIVFSDQEIPLENSTAALVNHRIIAPLWDDLTTDGTSVADQDIYVETLDENRLLIRWRAALKAAEPGQEAVNVEAVLYRDGRIQFSYGDGNRHLTPTVGISAGDGERFHLAAHNGRADLDAAETIVFTPNTFSYTIELAHGWNLVSLPLIQAETDIDEVLAPLTAVGGIESVWQFDAGIWRYYDPANPADSTLWTLEAGWGYWIKTLTEDLSLTVEGAAPLQPPPFSPGWNLVGCNALDTRLPAAALGGPTAPFAVWGYQSGRWRVFHSAHPAFSNLDGMGPGRGYWVYVEE